MYFEDALHFGQRLVWAGDFYAHSLGSVNTGTAAEADDGGTMAGLIERCRLIHIGGSRIGYSLIINNIGDMILPQSLL